MYFVLLLLVHAIPSTAPLLVGSWSGIHALLSAIHWLILCGHLIFPWVSFIPCVLNLIHRLSLWVLGNIAFCTRLYVFCFTLIILASVIFLYVCVPVNCCTAPRRCACFVFLIPFFTIRAAFCLYSSMPFVVQAIFYISLDRVSLRSACFGPNAYVLLWPNFPFLHEFCQL